MNELTAITKLELIIPREGTETVLLSSNTSILFIIRTDNSPRGDGNYYSDLVILSVMLLELIIPREGTET